ncbi:hypothetical protein PsYK624_060880 [Phanerochaete sordida]|uniref:F-box domain-containing protein n=1 Tax=Phanerochaete sordida TaxID=48140 RepID=A0A9P3G9M9_9APHY|nr:hypothetical protein PsYK624_060880 [Phanerochaete sordida]
MPVEDLPAELLHVVVKFAYGGTDGRALACCALVCRNWRAAARPLVFERIKISSEDHLTSLEDLVENDSDVGPFVRTLTVRPTAEINPVPSPWLGKLAKKLPARLVRLHALEFICIFELGDAFEPGFLHELAGFATVGHLTVDKCGMHLALVYALAATLPSMRHFHVGEILPVPLVSPAAPSQLYPPRLTGLGLDVGDVYPHGMRDVASWVLGTPSRHTLRSLALVARLNNTQEVGRVLSELGPQLAELDLRLDIAFPPPLEAEIIRTDISLRPCTALRTLTLRHHSPLSPAVLELVAGVRSPVRCITVGVFALPDERSLPTFALLAQTIGDALAGPLQKIRVLFTGPIGQRAVLAKLQQDLAHVADDLNVERV